MTRSKKIFLIIAAAFLIIVALIAIDFSRKTTFPGKKAKTGFNRSRNHRFHSALTNATHSDFLKKNVSHLVYTGVS